MADLGNQKIKDTYQSVLQTDASGNLQNLSGGTPYPFIFNSGFTSNAGTLFGLGTNTPNETLTVVGDISGTTDLHIDGTSTLGSISVDGAYIYVGGTGTSNRRMFLQTSPSTSNPSYLYFNWGMQDTYHFYWGNDEDLDIHHTGSHGYIDNDTGSLYVTSSVLYLGDTTSETTVQDNLTVNDNLSVGDDLTVNTNTLYVDSTNGLIGVGSLQPTHKLTVSGGTGEFVNYNTTDYFPIGGALRVANGQTKAAFQNDATNQGLSVGDQVRFIDTTVEELPTYTLTIDTLDDGLPFANIFFTEAYGGGTFDTTSLLYNDGTGGGMFVVYNGTGTTFQVSGNTVMSGSTDLLDIFASSSITNQDVYWSASTGGISNSGLTGNVGIGTTTPNEKLTVVGDISGTTDLHIGGNGYFANVFLPSTGIISFDNSLDGTDQYITGQDNSIVIDGDDFIKLLADTTVKFQDSSAVVWADINPNTGDINTLGNINISGSTTYIGAVSGTGSVTAIGGFVGDVTGNADTVTTNANLTGDIVSTGNTTSFNGAIIANADINASAAIDATKIADGTVTSTEFQYINTLSSNAQTQLDAKQATIEAGARLNANLIGSSGSVGNSEYGYLNNLTHNIQTQLYERLFLTGGTMSGDLVASRGFNKSTTTDKNLAQGDIIYVGAGSTIEGDLVIMTSDGTWTSARANAVTSATTMLGIALGTDPDVDGVLIRGTYTLDHDVGTNYGVSLYLSDGTAGQATITVPDSSGDIVRIIGYTIGNDDEIWFDPDKTWVELS